VPAPDLVNRDFTAPAPNRLWVADATRIRCGQGAFWLAAVRDAFSRRIVGWATSDRCDTDLILAALEYAIWSRQVRDGQLIHHSDRGSNYTSFRFGQRLADNGILPSMGSVGDSYDNALMENFFSTLKTELVYRHTWRTREQAEKHQGYAFAFGNVNAVEGGTTTAEDYLFPLNNGRRLLWRYSTRDLRWILVRDPDLGVHDGVGAPNWYYVQATCLVLDHPVVFRGPNRTVRYVP
jgi:transposase InsO family protein